MSLSDRLTGLHYVQKVDGLYRVQQNNGMCFAMTLEDWREALRQIEKLEADTGDWLDE